MEVQEKTAYLEAVQHAADLVETESDPKSFLFAEGFDASAAAKRLTTYWKHRGMIFGEENFLKQMTLTDGGIMHHELI
jgi:hypothetical protein